MVIGEMEELIFSADNVLRLMLSFTMGNSLLQERL